MEGHPPILHRYVGGMLSRALAQALALALALALSLGLALKSLIFRSSLKELFNENRILTKMMEACPPTLNKATTRLATCSR